MIQIQYNPNIDTQTLGLFFVDNVDETYISFGDIYSCGRATKDLKWVSNLEEVISNEIKDILSGKIPNKEVIVVHEDKVLIGFAIIALEASSAVLEDLIVNRKIRGRGIGQRIFKAIEDNLMERGIEYIQLESAPQNIKAHDFFHNQGFKNSTVIMIKNIKKEEKV